VIDIKILKQIKKYIIKINDIMKGVEEREINDGEVLISLEDGKTKI